MKKLLIIGLVLGIIFISGCITEKQENRIDSSILIQIGDESKPEWCIKDSTSKQNLSKLSNIKIELIEKKELEMFFGDENCEKNVNYKNDYVFLYSCKLANYSIYMPKNQAFSCHIPLRYLNVSSVWVIFKEEKLIDRIYNRTLYYVDANTGDIISSASGIGKIPQV